MEYIEIKKITFGSQVAGMRTDEPGVMCHASS